MYAQTSCSNGFKCTDAFHAKKMLFFDYGQQRPFLNISFPIIVGKFLIFIVSVLLILFYRFFVPPNCVCLKHQSVRPFAGQNAFDSFLCYLCCTLVYTCPYLSLFGCVSVRVYPCPSFYVVRKDLVFVCLDSNFSIPSIRTLKTHAMENCARNNNASCINLLILYRELRAYTA